MDLFAVFIFEGKQALGDNVAVVGVNAGEAHNLTIGEVCVEVSMNV